MFRGNDYTRWLSRNPSPVPCPGGGGTSSQGNTSAVAGNRQASSHSRRQPSGSPSTPGSGSHSSPATGSPSTPGSGSHSSPVSPMAQPPSARLNDLTLEELLISPGRAHLTRLHPDRPPNTLWFGQDGEVAATIRSIFERDFKEPHANWTQTPSKVIDRWFETFAQTYNWDQSINARVRAEFDKKLKSRMCDQVSRWKKKWKRKGDDAKPKWIDPDVWAALVRYWRDPKSEAKSINSRNARYHDPDGTGIHKHRSGQTSFKARARKHAEKTGVLTPDFLQILEETHRKADGTFIDGKSESIYNEVSSRIQEIESELCAGDNMESSASGGLSIHTKNKIYTEVAPRKKNRIYGVGSLQQEAASAHTGPLPPPTEDPLILSQKLAVAEASLQAQATQIQVLQAQATELQQSKEKMHSYDVYFEYLADKDPAFAALFRADNHTRTNPEADPVTTTETTPVTGDNTGNGTATASLSKSF